MHLGLRCKTMVQAVPVCSSAAEQQHQGCYGTLQAPPHPLVRSLSRWALRQVALSSAQLLPTACQPSVPPLAWSPVPGSCPCRSHWYDLHPHLNAITHKVLSAGSSNVTCIRHASPSVPADVDLWQRPQDHLGPFARTAADLAVILNTIRGYDPEDIDTKDVNLPDPFSIDIKSLKVGAADKQHTAFACSCCGDMRIKVNDLELNSTSYQRICCSLVGTQASKVAHHNQDHKQPLVTWTLEV